MTPVATAARSAALHPTVTHWGAYHAEVRDGRLVAFHASASDPDPSPIGLGMAQAIDHPLRIRQPMVRQGWLERGPGDAGRRRGGEPFVPVSWPDAIDMVARELERVRATHGNRGIFAGSYGWASAGRFHHAQSQIHRFLNLIGGYARSVNTYSYAAAEVILPHVIGSTAGLNIGHTAWPVIEAHTRLIVAFGGIPLKSAQVSSGGVGRHELRDWLRRWKDAGIRFVNIGPVREDLVDFVDAEWLPIRPNTDVALMLALAHTLVTEGRHDPAFLSSHCVGFERFRPYLTGESDGQPKDAEWAAAITGLDAGTIRSLARRMAGNRTLINAAWSLQRSDHGEQTHWMVIALAAILGQIGLPGGGFGLGYGATAPMGSPHARVPMPSLMQGVNPVAEFIPVARITDMLLNPGAPFDYDGQRLAYPDARLVYWCGGNPFHHHQDLNRMVAAWQKPETIVVHEPWWNALSRHADIVLPVTTPFERNDLGASRNDDTVFAMHQAVHPIGEARNDYDIFADLADRFGLREAFTEGRSEEDWLRYLFNQLRQRGARDNVEIPDFDAFWRDGTFTYPGSEADRILMGDFRADPERHALPTPSGRIEIFSETIAGFGYDDCPPHPTWLEPDEWLGSATARRFPLHMISNQPKTRLHSQYDLGGAAQASKVQGREPMLIHPADAAARGIRDGDVVRLFNDRGACLAGAVLSEDVRPGVIQLATGAWYDPAEPGVPGSLEQHGNPNVLTPDKGTSKLAQGPIAQSVLVEAERFDGPLPPVRVTTTTPPIVPRRD